MYKHSALSIKETEDRQFASLEEKNQISNITSIDNYVSELENTDGSVTNHLNELEEYVHNNDSVIYEDIEGSYITVYDSMEGSLSNIEILGNTIQDSNNLADIKSVGKLREDGLYEIELTSRGKNLFNPYNNNFVYAIDGNKNPKASHIVNDQGTIILKSIKVDTWGFVEFKNVKVKPGIQYTINPNATVIKGNVAVWVYEGDTKLFEIPNQSKSFTPNSEYISVRLYVQTTTNYEDAEIHYNVQLEEGTISTIYEQYNESKTAIILPNELRGLIIDGKRIADTILYNSDENRFYIKQCIYKVILDKNKMYYSNGVYTHTFGINTPLNMYSSAWSKVEGRAIIKGLTELPTYTDTLSKKGFYLEHPEAQNKHLIGISSVGTEEFDFFEIYYQLFNPMYIELPLDTQIQLNSFFGTTNVYMESGDVDGVIKCKVSKSLGGSINSLNEKTDELSNRLSNIETLQEGNELSITTDKGYVLCKDTRDGYIKDIKIEGNTLVNLVQTKDRHLYSRSGSNRINMTFTDNGCIYTAADESTNSYITIRTGARLLMKPSAQYTIIFKINENNIPSYKGVTVSMVEDAYYGRNGDVRLYHDSEFNLSEGYKSILVTTPHDLLDNETYTGFGFGFPCVYTTDAGIRFNISDTIVLEGDHTNIPPIYFEGLLSTGQDNMNLISNSANLFNIHDISSDNIVKNTFIIDNNKVKITKLTDNGSFVGGYIDTQIGEYYTLKYLGGVDKSATGANIYIYSDKPWGNAIGATFNTSDTVYKEYTFKAISEKTYIGLYCGQSVTVGETITFNNVMVTPASIKIDDYKPYMSNKKQILYKNNEGDYVPLYVLRKSSDIIKDTIEKHDDGKYYYHKRCEEIILNGSEEILTQNIPDDNCIGFYVNTPVDNAYPSQLLICDKVVSSYKSMPNNYGETIFISTTKRININFLKSRLSTQDIPGFKAWLQANHMTLVYQLEEEEVYECNNIELNSYDDETLVSIDYGVIPPSNLEFNTTSHIGNIISTMKEEVDKNTKFREEITESVTLSKEISNVYGVFEDTKEGVVSIDKIEGNTLVNLCNSSYNLYSNKYYNYSINRDLVAGKKYTLISHLSHAQLRSCVGLESDITLPYGRDYVRVFTPSKTYLKEGVKVWVTRNDAVDIAESEVQKSYFILLEGDHSQSYPVDFFEKMKSVGDLESEIKINSRKEDSNICDVNELKRYITNCDPYAVYMTDEGKNIIEFNEFRTNRQPFMRGLFKPNTQYKFTVTSKKINGSSMFFRVMYTDGTYSDIFSNNDLTKYVTQTGVSSYGKSIEHVHFSYGTSGNKTRLCLDDIVISENSSVDYIPHKSNSKQILYKNSEGVYEKPILRGTPNGVKDTIEKHSDGKYYYHKRCEEIILNGINDDQWSLGLSSSGWYVDGNTIPFFIYNIALDKKNNGMSVTDKFNTSIGTSIIVNDDESFSLGHTGYITIRINKSRLSAISREAFLAWIKANPVTVVYELATEEIYECNNLDLDSYNGETGLFVNNVIPPKVTAKVKSNLSDTVESLKNRALYLENKVSEMFKLALAGDVQGLAYELYPEDFEDIISDEELTPEDIMTLEEL